MESTSFFQSLAIALAVGTASGAIGAFIILRRMALVGDAMSHIALPGIALALAWSIDPFWGVLVFLLGAAIVIWWLESKTRLYADAIVGLLFTASLALGIFFIPDAELLESLFGEFPKLPLFEFLFLLVSASSLVFLVFWFSKNFLFSIVSPELAKIGDLNRFNNLLLLLVFAFAVALGIKLVGTLLMGALTVIPAAIAKNVVRSGAGYIVTSVVLGGAISLAGVFFAAFLGFLPGPTIILVGITAFLVSLFFSKNFSQS